jgi:hypothetical protein
MTCDCVQDGDAQYVFGAGLAIELDPTWPSNRMSRFSSFAESLDCSLKIVGTKMVSTCADSMSTNVLAGRNT